MSSTLPSNRHAVLLAGFAFGLILLVGYGSDLVLLNHPGWMISDDLILGIAAAVVVYHYEKQRGFLMAEKLRIIREMNSFIRNELQVLYASLDQPEQARLATIDRIVGHIEWALRELLPGKHSIQEAPSDGPPATSGNSLTRIA